MPRAALPGTTGRTALSLALAGLILGSQHGLATEYILTTLPTLVDDADVIVVGRSRRDGYGAVTIHVASYLKGSGPRRLEVIEQFGSGAIGRSTGIPDAGRGVIFVKRLEENWIPAGWPAFAPIGQRDYVHDLIRVARDPGPYLTDPRWIRNADLYELLGRRFDSFRVTSAEEPGLAEALTAEGIDPFSWSQRDQREVTVLLATGVPPRARGAGTPESDVVADLINRWSLSQSSAGAPRRVTFMFDTRRPGLFGSIGPRRAIDILTMGARSRQAHLVSKATWWLAELRAEEAVPPLLPLLEKYAAPEDGETLQDHEEEMVKNLISFLAKSSDARAVPALTALLEKKSLPEGVHHDAAVALMCIGGDAVLPVSVVTCRATKAR